MSELFPFQLEGAAHLTGGRVRLLADEMGLGKTPQAIRASEHDPDQKITIVAPAIMVAEWIEEIGRWHNVPRSIAIAGGKGDLEAADVVISSYDRTTRPDTYAALMSRRAVHMICDEAHYLKEPSTKRTEAALGENANGDGGLASRAHRVSFLTGTPAPNDAAELYAMLATAQRYTAGYWDFVADFCVTRETLYGPKITGYKNAAGLRDLLAGFMLRRTNAVELPAAERGEIIIDPLECDDASVLDDLRRMDRAAAGQIAAAAEAGSFETLDTPHLATLRRLTGLAKTGPVCNRAAAVLEADPSAKIVLFFQHRTCIEVAAAKLNEFGTVTLAGGTADNLRKKLKDRFQQDPATRVAICQMKAAGAGLTLTAANHLWIVEPSWTPADNDQAIKRILRIGQTRKTSLQFVTLDTSIDRAVNGVLRKKRQLIDEIIS